MVDRYIRHRLSNDARRSYDTLSDGEIAEILERHLGDSRRNARDDNTRPTKNPANFLAEGKKDERRYPRNPANPGLPEAKTSTSDSRRRAARDADDPQSSLSTPMPDEDPHAATRRDIVTAVRKGDEKTLRFLKTALGDEDFKKFVDIVLKELDVSPHPPQADDEPEDFPGRPHAGGEMTALRAEDAALLPDTIFSALRNAGRIRIETSTVAAPPRRREIARSRIVSLANDSGSASSFAKMFPSAARVKVG